MSRTIQVTGRSRPYRTPGLEETLVPFRHAIIKTLKDRDMTWRDLGEALQPSRRNAPTIHRYAEVVVRTGGFPVLFRAAKHLKLKVRIHVEGM